MAAYREPSCEAGMVLLKRWVERDPRTVEYLPNIAWADPPPALRWSHEWQEFHTHRCLCPKCNEMPRIYDEDGPQRQKPGD